MVFTRIKGPQLHFPILLLTDKKGKYILLKKIYDLKAKI